jgi:hypothetical protein
MVLASNPRSTLLSTLNSRPVSPGFAYKIHNCLVLGLGAYRWNGSAAEPGETAARRDTAKPNSSGRGGVFMGWSGWFACFERGTRNVEPGFEATRAGGAVACDGASVIFAHRGLFRR